MKINGQFIINISACLGFSQLKSRQKLNTLDSVYQVCQNLIPFYLQVLVSSKFFIMQKHIFCNVIPPYFCWGTGCTQLVPPQPYWSLDI